MTSTEIYRDLTIVYVTSAFAVEAQVRSKAGGRMWHLDCYGHNKEDVKQRVLKVIDRFLGTSKF